MFGQGEQRISKDIGEQDARVQHDGVHVRLPGLGCLVVQAQRFGLLDKFIESLAAFLTTPIAIGKQVVKADAAVATGLLERDLAVLEEFDQGWAADTEQVSGFLGGEALGQRSDCYRASGPHRSDYLGEHFVDR